MTQQSQSRIVAPAERSARAHTRQGWVEGRVTDSVASFLGIPYAEPPLGPLRFRAPLTHRSWTGVRPAVQRGAQCLQNNPDLPAWLDPSVESEDCLVLNVWAPQDQSEPLPVMVWLHGGGFTYGSAGVGVYDGSRLAETGNVVVVSVNHRLNVFGYGWFSDLVDELRDHANVGQRDIEMALRWVRDNAEAFGGDHANVTVVGESGGGGKITALTTAPTARGLFDKMIIQSGSLTQLLDRGSATDVANMLLKELGITAPTIDLLSAIPAKRLKTAAEAVEAAVGVLAFRPVLDGSHITGQPWEGEALASVAHIPLLTGTTTDESVAFAPDLGVGEPDLPELIEQLGGYFLSPSLSTAQWAALIAEYQQIMPDAGTPQLAHAIATDVSFWGSALQVLESRVQDPTTAASYLYEFAWRTPCFGGMWSPHGGELPFQFGNLEYTTAWDGTDSEQDRAAADPMGHRFELSDAMIEAWATFARHGDPSTDEIAWNRWSGPDGPTAVLDHDGIHTVDGQRKDRWALVKSLPRSW